MAGKVTAILPGANSEHEVSSGQVRVIPSNLPVAAARTPGADMA
jgi:hypothetical protein